jgi:hypothetical protein
VSTPDTAGPADRPARPHPDPLAMTPGEKVAAEWEARHDVAARGRRGTPDAVQHYLSESRTKGLASGDATAARPPGRGAGASVERPGSPTEQAPAPRRPWWRFWQRT